MTTLNAHGGLFGGSRVVSDAGGGSNKHQQMLAASRGWGSSGGGRHKAFKADMASKWLQRHQAGQEQRQGQALQQAQAKANAANNKRYQDILDLYEGYGEAGMERIDRGEEQAMATGEQDLMSRGLGNTTIRGSMARGVQDDAELQRQGLQETVNMQKAGVMERRTDAGPNVSLYSQLLQQG